MIIDKIDSNAALLALASQFFGSQRRGSTLGPI
jgi:hypothetical protein